MEIDDRIKYHYQQKQKWEDKKEKIADQLNDCNEKIIFHWTAVQNLAIKKTTPKKEYM